LRVKAKIGSVNRLMPKLCSVNARLFVAG